MRRLLLSLIACLMLAACSSEPAAVRIAAGCDGPDGQCTRYVQGLDTEGAPITRSSVIVIFSAPVRVSDKPPAITAVTAATNFDTRTPDLKLVPVRSLRADPQNPRQIVIELDGLLADGSAIDLPDGTIKDAGGRPLGMTTVKVKSGLSPLGVALAGVTWEPADPAMYSLDGIKPSRGQTKEGPVRQELEARLRLRPAITDEQVGAVLAQYDGEALKKKVPDHRLRAGLLLLAGTSAEYAIQFIQSDTNRRGVPFEPIQVRSLEEFGAAAVVFYHPLIGRLQMLVDSDVAADTLEAIAVVLSHETLHSSLGGGSGTEETLAMAADTRVYEELLLYDPAIAQTPSELTRAENRLALALRNSGRFAFPRAGILPRPGVSNARPGVEGSPAASFKDLLFKPDFYGEIPKAGDIGSEVIEAYYQRISGSKNSPGKLKFDQSTLKLFDQVLDNGFSDEQILAILDALKLRPVPVAR